jgi:hypothetical protein
MVDIALLLGLDAYDLGGATGSGGSIVYANINDRRSARYRDGIAPYLGRFEAYWTDLTGLTCRFDRESLTALDQKDKVEVVKAGLEMLATAPEGVDKAAIAAMFGVPMLGAA